MRNYYHDYSTQYSYDTTNGSPPTLSEIALQGAAYCLSVFTRAAATSAPSTNTQYARWTQPTDYPFLLQRVRRCIAQGDLTAATTITNWCTAEKLAAARIRLRPSFLSVDFLAPYEAADASPFYPVAAGAVPTTGAALAAALDLKPRPAALCADALNRLRLPPIPATAHVRSVEQAVQLANPFLPAIAALILVDRISENSPFRGRLRSDQRFSNAVTTITFSKGAYTKYKMFRKVARGLRAYLPYFDFYLTAVTDIARMVEATTLSGAFAQTELHAAEILRNGIYVGQPQNGLQPGDVEFL